MPTENSRMQPEPVEQDAIPIARLAKPPVVKLTAKWVRIPLLAVGGMLASIFGIALYLNPYNADGSPRTMATHTTLGLPPCNFVVLTGKPCPSCGMTTSFSLLVRGDVRASLNANWTGTILAIGLGRWPSWSFIVAVVASVLGTPALYLSGYVTLLATLAPAASQTGRAAQVGTIRELPIDNGIPH